ncbi:MAG TPA: PocR ligand-binding domain-containing protein [Anaerolineaceae bacterium]|nr:PocR ligand-binding domain-containing protein [Anaerolineaceae bacterium]
MENLFTTKQVIELLKVDRITVYRMLQDGRLKAVKIGQQWRFPRSEVERLLSGEPSAPAGGAVPSNSPLPVHCIQTVQNLFSDVSQLSAVLVSLEGEPITQTSQKCAFCSLVQGCPSGLDACQNSWRDFAAAALKGETRFTCHAGLDYTGALVEDNGQPVGLFLIGEFHWHAPKKNDPSALAAAHGLNPAALQSAAEHIPAVSARQHSQVESWAPAAVNSIHSILHERSGFMDRLQQIANLTQLS